MRLFLAQRGTHRDTLRALAKTALVLVLSPLFTSCNTIRVPLQGASLQSNLVGNWQFELSPTSGSLPFASLAGFLDQESSSTMPLPLTASLQIVTPSPCFSFAGLFPFHGQLSGSQVNLSSFSYDGQFMNVTTTEQENDSQLSGTYEVIGGCAGGSTGTIAATKYAPLNGTYAGAVTGSKPTISITLHLSQSPSARGDGTSPLSGSAEFTGIPCFTQGTLPVSGGSALGSSVELGFVTNDPAGSQAVLNGTFDPAAGTITLPSIRVVGGGCAGSFGAANLLLQ